jgi:large subunit ribosomal protein L24
MRKIKKGDSVVVIAGKDKGRKSVVLSVIEPKKGKNLRVRVEGVNMIKRHTKPNPAAENPGGIIEQEASIDISNIAAFNKATDKKDRINFKVLEDGRKVRVYKSTGEVVD